MEPWLFQLVAFSYEKLGRLCYVGPIPQLVAYFKSLSPELVASNTKDLVASVDCGTFVASAGRLRYIGSLLPSVGRETFVASAGRLRYVGALSLQLVASATWKLCRSSWLPLLRGTFVTSVGRRFCYRTMISSGVGSWSFPLCGIGYLR